MPDFADYGSAVEEQHRADALAAQQAESERQARIDESMHGYDPSKPRCCIDCGELILPERLRIYPAAGRCTECSSAAEKRLRMRHG